MKKSIIVLALMASFASTSVMANGIANPDVLPSWGQPTAGGQLPDFGNDNNQEGITPEGGVLPTWGEPVGQEELPDFEQPQVGDIDRPEANLDELPSWGKPDGNGTERPEPENNELPDFGVDEPVERPEGSNNQLPSWETDHMVANDVYNQVGQVGSAVQENYFDIQKNSSRIDNLENSVESLKGGMAMMAAMSSLPSAPLAVAVGYYDGKEALAFGTTQFIGNNTEVKLSVSTDFDTVSAGAGIGFYF